ncbi:MAG: DUF308 domain-containing protein [Prevotella sp.]|jgi:uncharacterized membrane protein HdeD (DUF308 family)|nr:DUF308 domain-containing protein [Prevotella sp.]
MKIFHSSLFRALCAIVVGVLILKFPQEGVTWLTMAVGELFLISGIVALVAYWFARRRRSEYVITDKQGRVVSGGQPTFPIVGAGSILLGLVLVIAPNRFVDGLMYVLGGIMILGGIQQLINLIAIRRMGSVPFYFWVCPVLIMLTGLFVILKPMETAELPLIILGWCCLVYGVTEIINSLLIWRIRRIADKMAQQGVDEEETVAEEITR